MNMRIEDDDDANAGPIQFERRVEKKDRDQFERLIQTC